MLLYYSILYFCVVIKKALHKIGSALMALVVLLSTLSFTVESHYCGDHLVDVAVFTKAKKCGTPVDIDKNVVSKKSCCKDVVKIIKGQDKLKLNSFNDLDVANQFLITSFVFTYFHLFESLPKQIIPHKNYSPPNLVIDYQVLHDVFVI